MKNSIILLTLSFLFVGISGCFSPIEIPFNDKRIAYEGRIVFKENAAELSWPATNLKINFIGSSISAKLQDQDTANYYNVIIDGKIISILHTEPYVKTYLLAKDLPTGTHSLELFKRTEWDKGKTWFYGFESNNNLELLSPPEKPKRKIEFFGNSIVCGYGTEDPVTDLPIGYFENCYNAYAAITARYFNAQLHCTAKSGIGITISWFPLIMQEMYDRLDPTDGNSKWNFTSYTPDVVVINLLQNDYWLVNNTNHPQHKYRFGNTPPTDDFIINAYQTFVKTVRAKYPDASIICMLGNMNIMSAESHWSDYVTNAVAPLHDDKIFTFFVPFKNTPGHPKPNEQKDLADRLIKFIEQNINW